MNIQRISVIGAGTMGNGIAHVFAQNGFSVSLVDVTESALQKGIETIRQNLSRQVKKAVLSEADATATLGRITPTTGFVSGVEHADLVVEAVAENNDIKSQVYHSLAEATKPSAILASNTSSISITWLGAQSKRAGNVIGMHFFNPVPVMKLVEIVRGYETSDTTYQAVFALAEKIGKSPVTVQDYPGFVSNRILMPMINEAIYCVMEGVATPQDIDMVMRLGMAHPMGPLALADFIGLDVCLSIMDVLHRGIGDDKYRPCPLLRNMVTAGLLGKKSGKGFYSY
ncbi:MAG TPA: 3-hydroxybutyryl-CoA dehydrogenase [Rhodothermales bacterium]|nr:3-hydroxybutyryl-CoA dehydrogenase [Rhodothermales bacterium]HRR08344.1 3-hydroxybutyryl-CoA dehydrogenase [Rhodothermales bacterium]